MRERTTAFLRRNSAAIALGIITFCICGIFILQALTIAGLSNQVQAQSRLLDQIKQISLDQNKNAEERSKQIAGVDRHLDCIVMFFSQSNRDQKAIQDIDQCRIEDNSNGSSVQRSAVNSRSTPRTSVPTAPAQSNTVQPQPTQPTTNTPDITNNPPQEPEQQCVLALLGLNVLCI